MSCSSDFRKIGLFGVRAMSFSPHLSGHLAQDHVRGRTFNGISASKFADSNTGPPTTSEGSDFGHTGATTHGSIAHSVVEACKGQLQPQLRVLNEQCSTGAAALMQFQSIIEKIHASDTRGKALRADSPLSSSFNPAHGTLHLAPVMTTEHRYLAEALALAPRGLRSQPGCGPRARTPASYLNTVPDLRWDAQCQEMPDEVHVEVDSDWAQCLHTRRSTGAGLLFWCQHLLNSYSAVLKHSCMRW